jgi:hypothetical protein
MAQTKSGASAQTGGKHTQQQQQKQTNKRNSKVYTEVMQLEETPRSSRC